jgi:tetratricopeptide (TPR) repeat protein
MTSQLSVPPNTREPSRASGGVKTRLSEALLETWRRAIDRLASRYGPHLVEEDGPHGLYYLARQSARAGDLETAAQQFADIARRAPGFTPALEAYGEAVDRMGRSALARSAADSARKLRADVRRGAPDRPFVLRNRGPFPAEIAAYSTVLQSVKQRALPYVARGNAFLAEGRAKLALLDYGCALTLKSGLHEITALKAEALAMLGQYREALAAFDSAMAARPTDAEICSGRAIAHLALGELDAARADWRRQLDLLPPERASARACVALRMADYEAALPELGRALEKEPADPYWRLYRLTALRRLGRNAGGADIEVAAGDAWPGPLLALHAGRLSATDALQRADNEGRRAEALFQLGILAGPHDPAEARRRWEEVVGVAPPALIEHAAARQELARPGA